MSTAKSSSSVTAGAIALAACLMSGCSSTMPALELETQCPKPERPDRRLTETPCVFMRIDRDQADPLAIVLITKNNQCARQIREHYTELQRWTKEQLSNDTTKAK